MPGGSASDLVDFDGLAAYLSALGYPVRLELLHLLRSPHVLTEIKLAPRRGRPGDNPDRPSSRPVILGHLDTLQDADLVRMQQVEREGRRVNLYAVNSLKLYAVAEDLRRLAVLHAGRGPTGDATGTLRAAPEPPLLAGPRLVLVHGLYEGRAFPLPAVGPAVLGRRKGSAVCLDYDPFVSMEHAAVERGAQGWVLRDLPNKNGTWLNWRRVPKDGARPLKPGDVVGVGRSLLTFAAE